MVSPKFEKPNYKILNAFVRACWKKYSSKLLKKWVHVETNFITWISRMSLSTELVFLYR